VLMQATHAVTKTLGSFKLLVGSVLLCPGAIRWLPQTSGHTFIAVPYVAQAVSRWLPTAAARVRSGQIMWDLW
jgi:hypothetical protein